MCVYIHSHIYGNSHIYLSLCFRGINYVGPGYTWKFLLKFQKRGVLWLFFQFYIIGLCLPKWNRIGTKQSLEQLLLQKSSSIKAWLALASEKHSKNADGRENHEFCKFSKCLFLNDSLQNFCVYSISLS